MKSILTWFKKLFTGAVQLADVTARTIAAVSSFAEPIVAEIAAQTENRTDDKLVELYRKYGIPNVERYLALPQNERGDALLHAAATLVQAKFPAVRGNLIRAGIEIALAALRDREQR